MDEEEIHEQLSDFSDRQIVATIIDMLNKEQLTKLIKELKSSYSI